MPMPSRRIALSTVTALCGLSLGALPAFADDTASISSIEKQIRALQGQLNRMKSESAARSAEVRAARQEAADANRRARQVEDRQALAGYAPGGAGTAGLEAGPTASGLATPPRLPYRSDPHGPFANVTGNPGYTPSGPGLKQGQFVLGGVRVTLGGFIEAASIFRTRNETADISSSYNTGIPLPNSPNYHQPEFRGSARASRLALLVEGTPNPVTRLTAFYESDFNSSGVTSNSNESDSYTMRVRHVYAQYTRTDWDFYILGGQTWSLATMNKTGMVPRQENVPLTIDSQPPVGFVWTR
ncbi:MAG: hypothetical protein INR65_15095, partial [Gluconacetobacter diazotrophicus]|nr:hypothetical protein [Gluconacetobacter diazotrophicus]